MENCGPVALVLVYLGTGLCRAVTKIVKPKEESKGAGNARGAPSEKVILCDFLQLARIVQAESPDQPEHVRP